MLHIQTEGAYDTIKWNKAYTRGIRKAPRLVINTYLGALLGKNNTKYIPCCFYFVGYEICEKSVIIIAK